MQNFFYNIFFVSRQVLVSHQLIINNFFSSRHRQSSTNRQSSIVNSSSAWRKIYLFCAVLRLFPGIGVALCYLCMRDAQRKVLHFLGFKLFLNFLKKNFAIQKTFVLLHSTNKQNDKMTTQTNSHILASFVLYDKYGKYRMMIKPFNNEAHMTNYILLMQRDGAKFVSTKIIIND